MGIAALNPSYGLDCLPMPIHSPWRADFPGILALEAEGQTYLDSAATAQKPQAMLDALLGYYAGGAANVHRAQHLPGERATRAFEATREKAARWLNAPSAQQIIFTRSATEAYNLATKSSSAPWNTTPIYCPGSNWHCVGSSNWLCYRWISMD